MSNHSFTRNSLFILVVLLGFFPSDFQMIKKTPFSVEIPRTANKSFSPYPTNRSTWQNFASTHDLRLINNLPKKINLIPKIPSLMNSNTSTLVEFTDYVNHSIIYDSFDQFIEKIVFDLEINVNKSGDYIIETNFNRTEGNENVLPIVNETLFSFSGVGFQPIKIELSSFQITNKLKTENFSLELVSASLFFNNHSVIENRTDFNYEIKNLFIGDFKTVGKVDSRSLTISPLDLNENGLFDAIDINTSVNIEISGDFIIIGDIYGQENETWEFLTQFFKRFSSADRKNFSFIIDSVVLLSLEQAENQQIRLDLVLVTNDFFLTDFLSVSNITLSGNAWEKEMVFDVQMEFKEYFDIFFGQTIKVINIKFVNTYNYNVYTENEFYIEAENKSKLVHVPQIFLLLGGNIQYDSDFFVWGSKFIVEKELFTAVFIIKYFGKEMEYQHSFTDGFKSKTKITTQEEDITTQESKSLSLSGITGIFLILVMTIPKVIRKRKFNSKINKRSYTKT